MVDYEYLYRLLRKSIEQFFEHMDNDDPLRALLVLKNALLYTQFVEDGRITFEEEPKEE